jgi:type II secretory pathway pseudopilin PulG
MKNGFTIIEILVSITVMFTLMAIALFLWGNVSQKVAYNQAIDTLEHVDHWLEEYYAIYGNYPATKDFLWENPDEGGKPNDWDIITGANSNINTGLPTGLCMWFEIVKNPRLKPYYYNVEQSYANKAHDADSADYGFEYGMFYWTNSTYNLIDPWGREYYYRPDSSLQSYETYSSGPDGIVGTGDDVSYEAFTE